MQFFRNLALFAAAILPLVAGAPTLSTRAQKARALQEKMGQVVADNYIVVLKSDLTSEQVENHQAWASDLHAKRLARRDDASLAGITAKYSMSRLTGYAGSFDADTIETIKASDDVAYIEEDKVMVAFDIVEETDSPSWGIARVSQKSTSADETTYYYDSTAGSGATAYVIDTGIHVTHETFGGRAVWGANFADSSNDDGYGHGTHVSGTIGGTEFGIAKKVSLVAVKVLGNDGSGTTSGVISGVQWAANNATAEGKSNKSVANMSLGGGLSTTLNAAVASAVDTGITFAVAAGNSETDASSTSPASEPSVITVGATDSDDSIAYYSNYGSVVDVFGPGTDITSSWIGSNTATDTISGTSMATPHVAGTAAYLIIYEGLSGSTAVTARIKELAVAGVVSGVPSGTTDALLYTGAE